YATEARNTTDACGPFFIIFNPSGTTHRDHFPEAGAKSLAVHVPRTLERQIEAAIPVSSVLHHPALKQTMRLAHSELATCDSSSPFRLEVLGFELVALCAGDQEPISTRQPPYGLKRVRDRVREESCHDLTVASLAADAGVHPVHLARVFRHFLGTSPGEYLR